MALQTVFYTYGAHHLISLTKTAPDVSLIESDYDGISLIRLETEMWLKPACDGTIDISSVTVQIENPIVIKHEQIEKARKCTISPSRNDVNSAFALPS